jgi:hypothetical protein
MLCCRQEDSESSLLKRNSRALDLCVPKSVWGRDGT